jgi:uncharacterized membrane protein YjgN (DUF898 family)
MLLTVCTLGIYYFWAKTKVRNYFYSQTEFSGARFAYHGTGKELFFGGLKAFLLLGIIIGLSVALPEEIGVPLNVLAFLLLGNLAVVGAIRYRVSRSSWQGIRFSFRGEWKDYFLVSLKSIILPAASWQWLVENTYYGNRPFKFSGTNSELWSLIIKGVLLSMITFGIYSFWFRAGMERYLASHISFAGARFHSTVTGGGLLGLELTNWLLVAFTFGIGMPWAQVRKARFVSSHVSAKGDLNLASIRQEKRIAKAGGEGLADAMDVSLGF